MEKLITKSFKRLLDKGIHRGFITYEELKKSLGKRHFSQDNVEEVIVDASAVKGHTQPILVHSKNNSKIKTDKTSAA